MVSNWLYKILSNKRIFLILSTLLIIILKTYNVFIVSINGRYYCASYLFFSMLWERLFINQISNLVVITIIYNIVFTILTTYILSFFFRFKLWYISWILMFLYAYVFLIEIIDTNKIGL